MHSVQVNYNVKKSGTASSKHLLALRSAWTGRRLANLLLCEAEKRLGVTKPRSRPYVATIDLTNACNLRCPGCPTGVGIEGRPRQMLSVERIERFLDESGPYLLMALLYNWGESLLHPQVAEAVRRIHDRRIFTSISSNLNIRRAGVIESVCEAGLDHLLISADGASEETYRRYRVGGDLELVKQNVRRVVEWRRANGTKRPILEWQVLAFDHVEGELDAVVSLAAELGVDWVRVKGPTAPDRLQPSSRGLKGGFYGGRSRCDLLWHGVTLQADGGLAPCCNLYHARDDFGHLDNATVGEVRRNERSVTARRLFDPRQLPTLDPALDHPCLRCPVVHRVPHLEEYLRTNPHARVDFDFMGILPLDTDASAVWRGL